VIDHGRVRERVERLLERPHDLPHALLGWLELSSPRRLVLVLALTGLAALAALAVPESSGLDGPARRALAILVLAVGLWLTEAIPAFATSLVVIAAAVLLVGEPRSGDDWERSLMTLGHPLIWLFFGGLVLASGMQRTGVDRRLAALALLRFAHRPPALVVAIAASAFVLSMIISNTATTAMMLALVTPLLRGRPVDDRLAATVVLAVPVGANLGGMASLVGTPPNAIAAGLLASETPLALSFADWFLIGLPPALVLAGLLVTVLVLRLPADAPALTPAPAAADDGPTPRHWEVLWVALTLATTLGLWLTQDLHGLPTPVVAVLPVVALTATGILGVDDFRRLPWDVLFLLAGGLVLGQVIVETGLAAWIVEGLALASVATVAMMLVAGAATVVLSNVMSNTAAANVLVPLTLSASLGAGPGATLAVALCASTAMLLPVSTPPNALAHASGRLRARDFLLVGGVAALAGPPVAAAWLTLLGRLPGSPLG
jgi:sodium-dependent dicarboxylate transporter 2/3/5